MHKTGAWITKPCDLNPFTNILLYDRVNFIRATTGLTSSKGRIAERNQVVAASHQLLRTSLYLHVHTKYIYSAMSIFMTFSLFDSSVEPLKPGV